MTSPSDPRSCNVSPIWVFLGINLPEEYGGAGAKHLDAVLVLEELAKISIAVAFPVFESCFGPALAIAHFAPEELRRRVLPKVCFRRHDDCSVDVRAERRIRSD